MSGTYDHEIVSGMCDDDMHVYVPGVNCLECGRFVGRDGWISIEHFEMSSAIASVEGTCARCLASPASTPPDGGREQHGG